MSSLGISSGFNPGAGAIDPSMTPGAAGPASSGGGGPQVQEAFQKMMMQMAQGSMSQGNAAIQKSVDALKNPNGDDDGDDDDPDEAL